MATRQNYVATNRDECRNALGICGVITPREREVVALVARGLSNRSIADALVVSERTVETHVGHLLGKLGLTSRAQLAAQDAGQPRLPTSRPSGKNVYVGTPF